MQFTADESVDAPIYKALRKADTRCMLLLKAVLEFLMNRSCKLLTAGKLF